VWCRGTVVDSSRRSRGTLALRGKWLVLAVEKSGMGNVL